MCRVCTGYELVNDSCSPRLRSSETQRPGQMCRIQCEQGRLRTFLNRKGSNANYGAKLTGPGRNRPQAATSACAVYIVYSHTPVSFLLLHLVLAINANTALKLLLGGVQLWIRPAHDSRNSLISYAQCSCPEPAVSATIFHLLEAGSFN